MLDLTSLLEPEHSVATHPDLPGYKAFFMPIGPELAEKLLDGYKAEYRPYLQANGEAIGRAMSNGLWIPDGAPIRLMEDGSLGDGQHRLKQLVKTGKTFVFLVVVGLPMQAYDSMDTGAIRNYAASLVRRGYTKNAPLLAWFIQLIHRWENGLPLLSEGKVIHGELDITFDKHKDEILRCVDLTVSGSKRIKMAPALVAFCWWMFRRVDVEQAHIFMHKLSTGEGEFRKGDPILALRNKLDDVSEETKRTKGKAWNRHHFLRVTFYTFNTFMEGSQLVGLNKGDGTRNSLDRIDPVVAHAERLKDLREREG